MDYPWNYTAQPQDYYPPPNYSGWSSPASPYAFYEQPPQQPYYHAPPSSPPYAYDSYTPCTSPYTFQETYSSSSYQPYVENHENMHSSYMPYHTGISSGFKDTNKEAQSDALAEIRRELDELGQQLTLARIQRELDELHQQHLARLRQETMDREKEELLAQPQDDLTYKRFTIPYVRSHDQGLSWFALKTKHELENIKVPEESEPREEVLRVDHDKEEAMRQVVILPEESEPKEEVPRVDDDEDEVKEEILILPKVSKLREVIPKEEVKEEGTMEGEREGFEREESQCGDSVKEKDVGLTTPIMQETSYILHSLKTCMTMFYDIGFMMHTYTYLLLMNSLLTVNGKWLYAPKHPRCGVG